MSPKTNYHFKVAWRFTNRPLVVRDYIAPDLATLSRMIERSENVSTSTVDELVIHQTKDDGRVWEVLAWSRSADLLVMAPDKPAEHKLSIQKDRPNDQEVAPLERYQTAAYGLYVAYEF